LLLVVFVPLAHLQVWLAVRKGSTQRRRLLALANAVAIGVSIFYSIVYLPIMPVAVVAIAMAGMGLLPMAPIFALIAGIILRRQLNGIAPERKAVRRRGLALGLSIAFAMIILLEIPASLTRVGLQMAASDSPEQSARIPTAAAGGK
jgi:cytochrome bd-type quinol oxidase subunit 2